MDHVPAPSAAPFNKNNPDIKLVPSSGANNPAVEPGANIPAGEPGAIPPAAPGVQPGVDPAANPYMDPNMDPNLMPPEMLPADEPQGIFEQVLDFNPHRKTLEVFLMLAMFITLIVIGSFSLISYIVVDKLYHVSGEPGIIQKHVAYCVSDACNEHEHRVLGYISWSRDKCAEFYRYACDGFEREAIDPNVGNLEISYATIAEEYEILIERLAQDEDPDWPADTRDKYQQIRSVFAICRTDEDIGIQLYDTTIYNEPNVYTTLYRHMKYFLDFPLFRFHLVFNPNLTVYLDVPKMFVPNATYSMPDFRNEYKVAFEAYLDQMPNINIDTDDIDDVFELEKSIAEAADVPKHMSNITELYALLTAVYSFLVIGEVQDFVYDRSIRSVRLMSPGYFKALRNILNATLTGVLRNYLIFRGFQHLSLMGRQLTPIARLWYKFKHYVLEPPTSPYRCLAGLDYLFGLNYMELLRYEHVHSRGDIHPMSQIKADEEMKTLVFFMKSFLDHSILDPADRTLAHAKLDSVQFKHFYPGALDEVGYHPDPALTKLSRTSGRLVDYIMTLAATRLKEILHNPIQWELGTFSSAPLYSYPRNTLYIPYSVYAQSYVHVKSPIPFDLPMYGFPIARELFKVFSLQANWWTSRASLDKFHQLETCIVELENKYKLGDAHERYETAGDIAAPHLLYYMYNRHVYERKNRSSDIRFRYLKAFSSKQQFYLSLITSQCARTDSRTRLTMNRQGIKTADQRIKMILSFMPNFYKDWGCSATSEIAEACLFWPTTLPKKKSRFATFLLSLMPF